jgi:SAM-dependent methyltransferase
MSSAPKYDPALWNTMRQMHTLRLTDAQRRALLTNRERIGAMLQERTPGTTATPSECWTDGCAYFSYSLELPPEAWTKLRLHTYHFTGDNYQSYLWNEPGPLCGLWASQVADLPEHVRLGEPPGGIGFPYQGRLISHDIVRFQRVIGTLHRQGVLERLAGQPHPVTLEIGSGYGGLAYHLHRVVGRGTRVLLDLPETLLFAANYLTLNCPDARIYLYSALDAATALVEPHAYDFILLPNFRLDLLTSWRFDLALNVESLQEMRSAQVDEYLAFLARTSGLFYSWNQEANPANRELDALSDHLRRYFQLSPVSAPPAPYKARARAALARAVTIGLARMGLSVTRTSRKWVYPPVVEYLCRPR